MNIHPSGQNVKPPDEKPIKILLLEDSADDAELVQRTLLNIADDGVGMAADKKTHGIGLKNIKGRLSIINGMATVQTVPGKGFTLHITIPLDGSLI